MIGMTPGQGSAALISRPKNVVYVGKSLDGYIARTDGAIDWLGEPPVEGGEDYGRSDFLSTIDGIVMGRNTY